MIRFLSTVIVGLCMTGISCQHQADQSGARATLATVVPDQAEDVRPLGAGEQAPTAHVRRASGERVDMAALYRNKPTVLIFYRGGWCPYCSAHLGQIAQAEAQLVDMGYQVLAISPDRPEALQQSLDNGNFRYELLADSDMSLAKAFGVAFRVDDETVQRYRGFGIDLAQASERNHHLLPVPAVYIIDTQGVIRFAHWNPDYKTRLQPAELLQAARETAEP